MAIVRSSPTRSAWARKGLAALGVMTLALSRDAKDAAAEPQAAQTDVVLLPGPGTGAARLDDVLRRRRSTRAFSTEGLSREHLGQLCWAAQGLTDTALGLRTAPSAGALYPLELYVVLPEGVFHYEPRGHRMKRAFDGDRRTALAGAALGQDAVRRAAGDLVITSVTARTRAKYGDRAERYAHMEAGHAAQNVLLEATALGLAAVPVGAFDDDGVRRAIGAGADETPLYVIAMGHAP